MSKTKSNTIVVLILNAVIIIGAGHGIGPLGLIELFWSFQFFGIGSSDFSMSLYGSYNNSLGAVALFSFFGSIFLITSLIENYGYKWLRFLGLIFLWIGFYYLSHNLLHDFGSQMGFITGLPFLIVSLRLAYKLIKHT